MIRISALNEESDTGSSDEDEPKITKEAEVFKFHFIT